ncbi:transposase [Symbiobacterium terraclitae]|uniref:Transposase n=1 Tax=Symbiobacterium terraclitae TaxID=557451 RepID=A0ABS4K0L5_9FIRM|nr:IS21 family transposase [Symbiobacterium terraclitae]MBP2020209.1 transposase [Symbiobacterium terraclitae]
MRKIKEVLRLKWEVGLSARQIARSLSVSHSTVLDLLRRFERSEITWPLPEIDDSALEAALYPGNPETRVERPLPDMAYIHRELARKGVTLQLLWWEYKQNQPDGLQYSQFCQRYREWREKLDVVLRQQHRAGEQMQVDFVGGSLPIHDRETGEVLQAQIFVAVLPASNYTFAKVCPSQSLRSWIAAHCDALEFFGGAPEVIVPDNPKAGVTRACRYEPDLNPTYADMASHYGAAVIPARPRKPKDKAKVENAVLVVERWILAALRNRTFFSLREADLAVREAVEKLNNRPFQKLEGTRRSLYETLDKPALKPLPPKRYEYAEWRKAKVNMDYHVEVDRNYYSVPYQLVGETLDIRFTDGLIEALLRGKLVACHPRATGRGRYVTQIQHMPAAHRRHREWTPSRLVGWAESVGPQTVKLVTTILEQKPHPEQGYRSCLGIMQLGKKYGLERLEAASARAVISGAYSYSSMKSILASNLDQAPLPAPPDEQATPVHQNLRGPEYYAQGGQ